MRVMNSGAIEAIQTIVGQHQASGFDVWVRVRAGQAPTETDEPQSAAEALRAIQALSDAGQKVTSVFAWVKDGAVLQEMSQIYPVTEEEGHTGSCCGGCGG
ncbi:MAG: hypothetical protein KA346_04695 [Neisseriaceae bacterium]|nr:hypothetical protein [Neisseriaceae bacterium]